MKDPGHLNHLSLDSVRMNELLLDSLPHPALVIRRDRMVLAANRCALEAGAKIGGYCWKGFGHGKYIPEPDRKFLTENLAGVPQAGTCCTFCLADRALDENRPENNPELEAFGRIWDTWWVPVGKDLYLHYAIDVTAQREAETVLRRSRDELEKLVAERTQDLQRSNDILKQEIAEREKAEAALRDANELLEKILSTTHLCIACLDRDFNFIRVNQAYAQEAGKPPEYFNGKNHFAIFPNEENQAIFANVVNTGIPYTTYAKPFVYPDDSGRRTTYWDWSLHPVTGRSGSVDGLVFTLVNVTDRQNAELELLKSEKRYRALFNDARDALFTATPGGNVVEANPAAFALFGYTRQELSPNFNALSLCARQEDRGRLRKALEEKGEVKNFEVGLCRKDGSVIDCLVTVSAILTENGERLGYQGTVHDITDMKQAQRRLKRNAEKLEKSNRELEDFAFIASHDLQEPLRKVHTFSQRLMTRCREKMDPQDLDYLERMCSAATRMKALIQALLSLSRINTRGQPLIPVNLGQMVREVIAGFEEPVHEYVEIGELPAIQADPSQMMQLFQNLIGNALKFRKKEKPQIRITSRPLPASRRHGPFPRPVVWYEIRVEDDGIGFDMEHVTRIFAPFQRLHGRSEYPGQGMGLAICKRVVERHGGTITAQGTPGEGARFIIRLPSCPGAAEAAEIGSD